MEAGWLERECGVAEIRMREYQAEAARERRAALAQAGRAGRPHPALACLTRMAARLRCRPGAAAVVPEGDATSGLEPIH